MHLRGCSQPQPQSFLMCCRRAAENFCSRINTCTHEDSVAGTRCCSPSIVSLMLQGACQKDLLGTSLHVDLMFPIHLTLQVGYWKDLLEILARQVVGEEAFQAQREAREKHNEGGGHRKMLRVGLDCC